MGGTTMLSEFDLVQIPLLEFFKLSLTFMLRQVF